MINKIILLGRATRDPEIRNLSNGRSVANFSLATNDDYKDKEGKKVEQTDFHNLVVWGPLVQVVEKYVNKGDLLYIEGKSKTRSWEKDGITRYATEVLVNNLTMLGTNSSGQNNQHPDSEPQPQEQESDDLAF